MRSTLALVVSIVVCELAGISGALVTDASFYTELPRPSWAPPGWVFGPVWITLYAMMGISAWLVWRTGRPGRPALTWFAVQLALNAAWTPVFFGLRSVGGGLAVIVALLLAIIFTLIAFAARSRAAAALLVPYLLWVCFATALNAAIFVS